jgi:hydrogenase expression/formation protein HypE
MKSLEEIIGNLGTDSINMSHGSGGLMTNRLLDNLIFSTFKDKEIQKRDDGAILNFNSEVAFSTDSFVISPIIFPGGNIGELAVNGTVNDVAMTGAIPKYISLAFILEEGLKISELVEVVKSIKAAADNANVKVVTGDTKVVEKGSGDKIYINTSGLGNMHKKANLDVKNIKTGDRIIVSGKIAAHGMAILSKRDGLEFDSEIESDTKNLNFLVEELLDNFGDKIKLFRDPTRGGVATVLNEIAQESKLEFNIKSEELPIDKQVAGACEIFGLDPLYVANEGVMIAIVDPSIAESALTLMKKNIAGADSAIIGEVKDNHIGKLVSSSILGGSRIVSMPIGEQLPRIC